MLRLAKTNGFLPIVALSCILLTQTSYACTSLFLPLSPDQVVAANMDWASGTGILYINKRDMQKTATFVNWPLTPLQWTSKYMSLTISQSGLEFPWEGMNEKGVSVNMLLYPNTQLPFGSTLPAVNSMQFVQYLLDTSASTADAVTSAQTIQIAGPFAPTEHFFVCDSTGSCATLEYVAGSLVIHQGSSLTYMALANSGYLRSTNNLATLLAVDSKAQILALPGTDSLTRFAKAAILSSQYTALSDDVDYAFSSLTSVQEASTQWQMVFLLASTSLQWQTTASPVVKTVELTQFDPHCSTGVQMFHVNSSMSGDVTSSFYQYTSAENNNLAQAGEQSANMTASQMSIVEAYPTTLTQCTEENATLSATPSPSSLGQAVALTAKVTGKGANLPTGTVTWENGLTVLGTTTLNSAGVGQFTLSTLPLGTNSLIAAYSGDANNAAISSPALTQTVYSYSAEIQLMSSINPVSQYVPLTFTATVTGQSGVQPTGIVTFYKDLSALGSVTLSNGQASLFYSFGWIGTKSITAVYSGDANYPPSTSAALAEGVGADPTTITLSSSANPVNVGLPVTLTATVTSTFGSPAGSVTFYKDTTILGTVSVVGGQASLNYTFGNAGMKALTAVFSGTSYANSTSPVLVQTVR